MEVSGLSKTQMWINFEDRNNAINRAGMVTTSAVRDRLCLS